MGKSLPSRLVHKALATVSLDRKVNGLRNYLYDYRRFSSHSSALSPDCSGEALAARITKEYHRIEKGLALPEPRPGFAIATVDYLLKAVPRLEAREGAGGEAGSAGVAARGARAAIRAWVTFHDSLGHDIRPDIRAFAAAPETAGPGGNAGSLILTREEILAATQFDFDRFAATRYSVRQFTGGEVEPEAIRRAVETALKTPRVCNRESRRVHAIHDPRIREKALTWQNGNRGFGHLAGAVLIITSDMRHFTDFGERNQCWVDGGMFAMSLANAFHAQGLGSCMLNWSREYYMDQGMRRTFGIPDNEAVITYMAVGHLPERITVAVSPHQGVENVLRTVV